MAKMPGTKIANLLMCLLVLLAEQCTYNDINVAIDCAQSDLTLKTRSKKNSTGCQVGNGEIGVTATGGTPPYTFSFNNEEYRPDSIFTELGPGVYTIVAKDNNECLISLDITIASEESNLSATTSATPDDQCSTNNGTITVTATRGKPPYQYQLNETDWGNSNIFTSLRNGKHTVSIKDAYDCEISLNVDVPRGLTGISYVNDIKPILDTYCNFSGCHGAGNGTRDWTKFNNVRDRAENIKNRTGVRNMPPIGELTQDQINMIACWVDDGALNN